MARRVVTGAVEGSQHADKRKRRVLLHHRDMYAVGEWVGARVVARVVTSVGKVVGAVKKFKALVHNMTTTFLHHHDEMVQRALTAEARVAKLEAEHTMIYQTLVAHHWRLKTTSAALDPIHRLRTKQPQPRTSQPSAPPRRVINPI